MAAASSQSANGNLAWTSEVKAAVRAERDRCFRADPHSAHACGSHSGTRLRAPDIFLCEPLAPLASTSFPYTLVHTVETAPFGYINLSSASSPLKRFHKPQTVVFENNAKPSRLRVPLWSMVIYCGSD